MCLYLILPQEQVLWELLERSCFSEFVLFTLVYIVH